MRNSGAKRLLAVLIVVIVVALALGGIGLWIVNAPWNNNLVNADGAYVIKPSDVLPEDAKCIDRKASFANLNGPFKFDDSVSSPLASRDAEKPADAFVELKKRICDEVGTGVAAAEMLNAKEVTLDGKTFSDSMPWIGEFIARAKDGGIVQAFWRKDMLSGEIVTTDEYRKYASMINALLMKFPAPVISKGDYSVANWHVPAHALISVQDIVKNTEKVIVPIAVRNKDYEENRTSLWFKADDKAGVCHLVIGFNVWDKRPLIGKCETPPPTNPPTSPPTGPPTGPPTRPPTSPPKCPPGQTGTPPNCLEKKDRSDDPVENGNSGNGGGNNEDSGPGATTTPKPVPTEARTNPAPPAPNPPAATRSAPPPVKPSDPPADGDPGSGGL